MKKYVYLFELDSVRKTDNEIIAGQKALYDEIVIHGNVIVLTYNQLVDSRGFFSLLTDEIYQRQLLALFENGAIRISQYGEIKTLSQYLICSMKSEKKFFYSAIPVKYSQKGLRDLIRRSLEYSDLSEVYEYYTGRRTKESMAELFIECEDGKESRSALIPENASEWELEKAYGQMREVLKYLYGLLKAVLRLSPMHHIYINPKNQQEYSHLKMADILEIVVKLDLEESLLWKEAVRIISELSAFKEKKNDRSVYLREIRETYGKLETGRRDVLQNFQYAEAIVNLCYNYACEISICNISKHYNVQELHVQKPADQGGYPTFRSDFMLRLKQDWKGGEDGEHRYLLEEKDGFEAFERKGELPDFEKAVRFTGYVSYLKEEKSDRVFRYEYEEKKQITEHKRQVLGTIGNRLIFSAVCIVLACVFELGFQFVQGLVDGFITLGNKSWSVIETLAFLFLTEAVTTVIAGKYPQFLSLSDAVGGIGRLLKDSVSVLFGRAELYHNDCSRNTEAVEKRSRTHMNTGDTKEK